MHLAKETILKKRDGSELSAVEIATFVKGVTRGEVSDAQIAALAMAVWFRGMNVQEQMNLTLAMRDSGQVLRWSGLDGPVLDKHSTGGVGDLVSLVLGPLLAACGAYVPMISGRGLGHTGGTLDKLESIPGFDTAPSIERLQRLVREQGIAIVGQTSELAPADRRIYAVRDVTATVASTPLIVSSILSKKLAEGLDALVMDIKYGSGGFSADVAEATRLARAICHVAQAAGLPCNAVLTGMQQPLAASAGNALEVREAIDFLRGDRGDGRLLQVVLALAGELLFLGDLATSREDGERRASGVLDDGGAAERFARMVCAQGGPAGIVDDPSRFLPAAALVRPVMAEDAGYVARMDTQALGMLVVRLGGGRLRAEDRINAAVGLSSIQALGTRVERGDPLVLVHAASESDWQRARDAYLGAVEIDAEPPTTDPVIAGLVEGEFPLD